MTTKRIKLLLLCPLLLIFSLAQATGIRFVEAKSWKEILALAKKENKLVFLDAYATWCGPCKYLQQEVFTDSEVGSFYNRTYINVKMDMEEGEGLQLAEELGVQSYPTLFFINGDGEVVHKKVGAMEVADFLQLGAHAQDPDRQYFTVKKQAVAGTLVPAAFHQWIHAGEELDDEEVKAITTAYLARTTYPRLEKEMLAIMLDHGALSEEQIRYLKDKTAQCLPLSGKTKDEYHSALLNRVIGYAATRSLKGEELDFALFQQTVHHYFPAEAALETRKIQIRYYHIREEYSRSLDVLAACLTDATLKLPAADLSSLIIKYIKEISSLERAGEFIGKVAAYKLLPGESTLAYHKDLALFALYLSNGDATKLQAYGKKILADRYAAEEIKTSVQKVLDNQ